LTIVTNIAKLVLDFLTNKGAKKMETTDREEEIAGLRDLCSLELINLIIDLRKDEGLDKIELYDQLVQLTLAQLSEYVVDLRHWDDK